MIVRKKTTDNFPFPDEFYRHIAERLYAPLLLGENSVLLCPQFFGRDYVVKYLSERTQDRKSILGHKNQHFYFTSPIHIGQPEADQQQNWTRQLLLALPQSPGIHVSSASFETSLRATLDEDGLDIVFFINILESLDDENLKLFLQLANRIYFIAPSKIHFILFLDHKWDEEAFTQLIRP